MVWCFFFGKLASMSHDKSFMWWKADEFTSCVPAIVTLEEMKISLVLESSSKKEVV